jgi:hypothetical protein
MPLLGHENESCASLTQRLLLGLQQLQDMADLVLRDRSHPSIMAWSFCNEVGTLP